MPRPCLPAGRRGQGLFVYSENNQGGLFFNLVKQIPREFNLCRKITLTLINVFDIMLVASFTSLPFLRVTDEPSQ